MSKEAKHSASYLSAASVVTLVVGLASVAVSLFRERGRPLGFKFREGSASKSLKMNYPAASGRGICQRKFSF